MKAHILTIVLFIYPFFSFSFNWTQVSDLGGSGRHRASSLVIGNRAYVGCGHINGSGVETIFNDWWEYDPATNAWTQKANIPWVADTSTSPDPFHDFLDFVGFELNGKGYVGKGVNYPFFSYSPATNTWTELNSIASQYISKFNSHPTQSNGLGYVYSSYDYMVQIYNSSTDSWVNYPNFSFPSGINGWWRNIISHNNIMYFVRNTPSGPPVFWSFNVETGSWTDHGVWLAPTDLSYETVFVHQGLIVSVGGESEEGNDVFAYDPINKNWEQLDDFPGAKRRYATGFTLNNTGYICTGTNGNNHKDVWRMDNILDIPETNNELEIVLYPNPVVTSVNITSSNALQFSYQLFSPTGQLVRSGKTYNGKVSIDRNDLPSGVYSVTFFTEEANISTKRLVFN
ncbi:MAG: T9SS type A sorting domain-containing protein [Crocinitomicaceae bacterium]|nr:T9SS type A sorting domain-containing protein [Crocinitomicaceae bacterium]